MRVKPRDTSSFLIQQTFFFIVLCSITIDTAISRAHRITYAALKTFVNVVYASRGFSLCN